MDVQARLMSKVEMDPNSGCWLWTAAVNDFGYGIIRVNKRNKRTHRLTWSWRNGPLTPGMDIMHKCDTPACCNPDHLQQGTRRDNVRDMFNKGRENPPKGSQHSRAKLTESDVLYIKREIRRGVMLKDLAAYFNVRPQTISQINVGKCWTHVIEDAA